MKDFSSNLENFIGVLKMLDILIYIRGITTSFKEFQRLKDIFESIWTKKEPTYDLPVLESILGDFSILLNISRLPEYTKRH